MPRSETERRSHDPARNDKQQEQHGVGCRRYAVLPRGRTETTQQFPHRHAGKSVGAAGDRRRLVCRFEQHKADAERHHQTREVGCPRTTRKLVAKPSDRAGAVRQRKPADRLAPAVHRKSPGRYAPMPKNAAWPSETMPA